MIATAAFFVGVTIGVLGTIVYAWYSIGKSIGEWD